MAYPEIVRPYDRYRVGTTFHLPSRAKQSFKDECDINNILRKFERGAVLEHLNRHEGRYGDYTELPTDYQGCLDQVQAANEMFASLPSKLRARFSNDPGAFLAFVSDSRNAAEMVALGLARASPPPADPLGVPAGGTSAGDGTEAA